MKNILIIILLLSLLASCNKNNQEETQQITNPRLSLAVPTNFPPLNPLIETAYPTQYGVALGNKLFHDVRLSRDNSISCATCHIRGQAYGDRNPRAVGVAGRIGLRNTPPIQNMAFLTQYMWDGAVVDLKEQPVTPIVTHEEMDSSLLEVIKKLKDDAYYKEAFAKAYGDSHITSERVLGSIAQFMYTLISANSKYDHVTRDHTATFTPLEQQGYALFEAKCASCHKGALFTDESFRNIGFPEHPDTVEEAGRGRVTGSEDDLYRFRVPSLRNVAYTAPYGSFGQFATLKEVLDYFDRGVRDYPNLDPILKDNGGRIPLTEQEKEALIAFMKTLSDPKFIGRE
jgi:cytoChrome-c peroxidase